MTQQSRLDEARTEQNRTGGEWYRSPLALVAGLILFVAVLALVVLGLTGGEDTATSVEATAIVSGASVAAPDADASAPAASAPAPEPIDFGGPNIPEVAPVTVVGDVLPQAVGGDDPAVGTLAPEITATSLASGGSITLGPGKARVIGFFAHWCGHCQSELPELTGWLQENQLPPNTEFIAVSTAVDEGNGNYPPSAWFTEEGFSSPVVVDDADNTLLKAMGFGGFPAFVAIDASGVVVARAGGNIGIEGFEELWANFAGAPES